MHAMDASIAILTETLTSSTSRFLGLSNLLRKSAAVAAIVSLSDQSPTAASTVIPVDAVAPPVVKPSSSSCKTIPRSLLRRRRRTKRRVRTDGGEDGGFGSLYGGDDVFGGGFGFHGGGGGKNWDFGGFGGPHWEGDGSGESSWFWRSGFAFDFVYEVIYWIALSNCVHFAFKKVVRGFAEREKVAVTMC